MARPRQLLNCSYHNLVSVGHIVVVVVYKQKSVKLESQTFIVIGCHCHPQGLGPYKGKVTGRKAYCCCYCCCCCCCSDCWQQIWWRGRWGRWHSWSSTCWKSRTCEADRKLFPPPGIHHGDQSAVTEGEGSGSKHCFCSKETPSLQIFMGRTSWN